MNPLGNTAVEQVLDQKGVRPTAMRILVYTYLASREASASLTEVEQALGRPDRTTLYRTMKTFETRGIVHSVDDGTGTQKYALCAPDCHCDLEQHLHLHFHCTRCGETVCLTEQKLPRQNLPQGFVAEDANLVIKGHCDACSGE